MNRKIVYVLWTLLSSFTFFALFAQTMSENPRIPNLYQKYDSPKMHQWVDSVFNTMSDDERIGQMFMMTIDPIQSERNFSRISTLIKDYHIGGILFQKGEPQDQATLTNIAQEMTKVPLLIALDGEWGLSMRLNNTTRFPKNMLLGALENDSLIYEYGKEVARQCKEMGIHINFAPTVDINNNPDNPVIGLRSFAENRDIVVNKALLYSQGVEDGGIISVAKHFPGHGDTSRDSHYTLPILRLSRQRLDTLEMVPFKRYINAGFAGIMTAHLQIRSIDPTANRPVSLSKRSVDDLLTKELGFRGLKFTDALAMKGAGKGSKNVSVLAVKAGNDILLSPKSIKRDFEAVKDAIKKKQISQKDIDEHCKKILRYKYIAGLNKNQKIETKGLITRLNPPYADYLAERMNAEAMTLLLNRNNIIPLKQLDQKKIAVLMFNFYHQESKFEKELSQYAPMDIYTITPSMQQAKVNAIYQKLKEYNTIICGVNTVQASFDKRLESLAKGRNFILAMFTTPYNLEEYKTLVPFTEAIVMGYEATPLAQRMGAQLIFGGIPAMGKLPVSIPELFFVGTGIYTEKSRLGYREPYIANVDKEKLEKLESIVKEGLDAKAYPGCQVLVAKDGNIIYSKAFGYDSYEIDKNKITDKTIFDLASVSKATGTLSSVIKAYDDKKIRLDAPLVQYLPVMKGSDKADIKVKELLFHESGVVPTINFYLSAIDDKSLAGKFFSSKKDAHHKLYIGYNTWVDTAYKFKSEYVSDRYSPSYPKQVAKGIYLSKDFHDVALQDIKESRLSKRGNYRYSCVNFILLQQIVEQVYQTSLDSLGNKFYFRPLGMATTGYNPLSKHDTLAIAPTQKDQFLRKQTIRGFVDDESAAFFGGVSGNAGLFSSANDLVKLCQLYLNKGEYGSERYYSEETGRRFIFEVSTSGSRGLGFDKPRKDPKYSPTSRHASSYTFGHTGFTGTCFWVDPESNLIYIFLSNRTYPDRRNKLGEMDIRTRIHDAIYEAINN